MYCLIKLVARIILNFMLDVILLIKIIIDLVTKLKDICKPYLKLQYVLYLLKALCFLALIYSAVLVTLDYLEFPYIFKLNVINNINGFDLPPISFCTETHVLFHKNKIIHFYNSSQEFQEYK